MVELTIIDDTNNLRSTAAQVLSTLAFSVLYINEGLILSMPTIVIGALRGDDSPFKFSESDASWFGSLIYIAQPLAIVMSAFLQDFLGRRTVLLMTTIPLLATWTIIYFATSSAHLFIAIFLMGIAIGFIEMPILTYIGETTQPRLRGVLLSISILFFNFGLMFESFLGAILPWKTMILINILGPLVGLLALSLVPESPAWLVTNERVPDAEKAYQWLRGWVKPEAIKSELGVIVSYVQQTQANKMSGSGENEVVSKIEGDSGPSEQRSKLSVLMEPNVLRAFRIILIYHLVAGCTSMFAMKPFLIEILSGMNVPLSPNVVVAVCGFLQIVGALCMTLLVKILKKRGITCLSLGLNVFCCMSLGAFLQLELDMPWVPVILFSLSHFSAGLGILAMPFILVTELFPLRARGIGGGLCGAFGYSLGFVIIKTYYNLVSVVNVSGACYCYGIVGILGFIYLYFDMPETEGVSLEVIEIRLRERWSNKEMRTCDTFL